MGLGAGGAYWNLRLVGADPAGRWAWGLTDGAVVGHGPCRLWAVGQYWYKVTRRDVNPESSQLGSFSLMHRDGATQSHIT